VLLRRLMSGLALIVGVAGVAGLVALSAALSGAADAVVALAAAALSVTVSAGVLRAAIRRRTPARAPAEVADRAA